jgi:hypothetical protein
MEWSNIVSIVSVFIAGLAALYARWAALAASRQNEIALHSERLRVYRGVVDYGCKLAGRGPAIKQTDVWTFNESVQLSEFYFNRAIFERLDSVFEESMQLLGLNDEWSSADHGRDAKRELNSQRHALHGKLRHECFAIQDEMKGFLRVAQS